MQLCRNQTVWQLTRSDAKHCGRGIWPAHPAPRERPGDQEPCKCSVDDSSLVCHMRSFTSHIDNESTDFARHNGEVRRRASLTGLRRGLIKHIDHLGGESAPDIVSATQ